MARFIDLKTVVGLTNRMQPLRVFQKLFGCLNLRIFVVAGLHLLQQPETSAIPAIFARRYLAKPVATLNNGNWSLVRCDFSSAHREGDIFPNGARLAALRRNLRRRVGEWDCDLHVMIFLKMKIPAEAWSLGC
jgi:hypothetical protein